MQYPLANTGRQGAAEDIFVPVDRKMILTMMSHPYCRTLRDAFLANMPAGIKIGPALGALACVEIFDYDIDPGVAEFRV